MATADAVPSAILDYVTSNTYPDSEDVSSAHLNSATLSSLLSSLRDAQNDARSSIRSLSSQTAPDIDTWISRAKSLQADILRSRDTAHAIVQEAEELEALRNESREVEKKVIFLEKEVLFTETLTGTLEHVRYAHSLIERTQEAAVNGDVSGALRGVEDAEASIAALDSGVSSSGTTSRAVEILQQKLQELKDGLIETGTEFWNALIHIDGEQHALTVSPEGFEARVPDAITEKIGLAPIVDAAQGLGVFDGLVQKLGKDLERAVFRPRMTVDEDGQVPGIAIDDTAMRCEGAHEAGKDATSALFEDLHTMFTFISTHLPASVTIPLSDTLIPAISTRLEEQWLEPAIPLMLGSKMQTFQTILEEVAELADKIDACRWHGADGLREWIDNAPRLWLTKRREEVLGEVRNLVFTGLGTRKEVERVETRVMAKNDAALTAGTATGTKTAEEENGEGNDDWDDAWDEPQSATSETDKKAGVGEEDDEDASAWDMDDDSENKKESNVDGEDADEDAWGWGDDDGGATEKPPSPVQIRKNTVPAPTNPKPNGSTSQPAQQEQEMTLRETFTVTSIPDNLLTTLQQIVSDAETISASEEYAESPLSPAAPALYTLPTLALAIYRATAPTAYSKLSIGNMLIYNDALRLSDSLRSWQADVQSTSGSRLRLDNDVVALETFAKRAYSSEMESQRMILRDLLDGAQGFVNCTNPPFKHECESAVAATVDRLKDVHGLWKGILSQGALLQSLGSLLGTVTSKMITEIEELEDISEPESQQLKILCDKLSESKSLFLQPGPAGGEEQDMTFIYCPTWLKFQYLGEIMESSLADIRWMWTEGELGLEFEAEEVVELIRALFAESDLRRKAISEIRGRR